MSQPTLSNEPTPQFRKPRANVYTVLLLVALIALIIGCLCLWGVNAGLQWKWKGGPPVSWQTGAGAAVVARASQRDVAGPSADLAPSAPRGTQLPA